MTSRCTACEQIIPATHSVRRVNNHVYHLDCFQCSVCKSKLKTGDKFYFLDDYKLICLKDHDDAKSTGEFYTILQSLSRNQVEYNFLC